MDITRSRLLVVVIALALTIAAIAGVSAIVERAGSSSAQQVEIKSLALSLVDLETAPFSADPTDGGSPAESRLRIGADEAAISRGLMTSSQAGVPPALLASGRSHLADLESLVTRAYRLATGKGGLRAAATAVLAVDGLITRQGAAISAAFASIGRTDDARAGTARTQAQIGAAAAMLLLLAAFAWFYLRSAAARKTVERLAHENEDLLAASRVEASTDVLTALGNRRALSSALAAGLAAPPAPDELLLAMYDLDGFKEYNDTFGHAAGDALLHRLGKRLTAAAALHGGAAYRMGGDEFCVLARTGKQAAASLLSETWEALTESGQGWHVGCSLGSVWLPSEAKTESQGLQLADERMYANKTTRSSARRTRCETTTSSAYRSCPVTLRRRSAGRLPRCPSFAWPGACTTSASPRSQRESSTSPARLIRPSRSSCAAIRASASASCSPRPPWPGRLRSFARRTSASTDTDIPMVSRARRFRSARASLPWPMRSTP
jgi:diguanylate cyclase (GGDEF)-like protein